MHLALSVPPPLSSPVLIPHLHTAADPDTLGHNETQKVDIVQALVDAYKEVVCCCIHPPTPTRPYPHPPPPPPPPPTRSHVCTMTHTAVAVSSGAVCPVYLDCRVRRLG